MTAHQLTIGLVIDRIRLTGPWADHAWMPAQVLTLLPEAAPWTVITATPDRTRYYAGAFVLSLHPSSTAQYRDNIESARPSLWVAMEPAGAEPPVAIARVTADTSEGEGFTETGTWLVETVPMPPEIAAALAEYVAEHHVEREFKKRKRDEAGPGRGGGRQS